MKRANDPKRFLTPDEKGCVEAAVAAAEKRTTAEIKLVIVRHCWAPIEQKAARVFRRFRLHETEARNAVLILLVLTNRQFLIYGDQGIHEKVGQGFWDGIRKSMTEQFAADPFGDGLETAIREVGEKLAAFFPLRRFSPMFFGDRNLHKKARSRQGLVLRVGGCFGWRGWPASRSRWRRRHPRSHPRLRQSRRSSRKTTVRTRGPVRGM